MGSDAPAPSRALTWGAVPRGLGAGVLVGHALQGRQGQVQAAVGAGPEAAEAVAVQVRVTSEAVVGEEVRDCVAPFGRVGGQGGAAEEAGEAGGRRDGLGSHIEILGFQPREPPEPVGNLTKEREADSASPAQSTRVQPCLKPRPVPFTHGG